MNTKEHLFTCLSEECIEVSEDIHKALRFGLDDRNVLNPTGPTNCERIVDELNDLFALIHLCCDPQFRILPSGWYAADKVRAKKDKVKKFMEYAKEQGVLSDLT